MNGSMNPPTVTFRNGLTGRVNVGVPATQPSDSCTQRDECAHGRVHRPQVHAGEERSHVRNRASGASPRQILTQFLVEALSLSLLGGIIGVGLGLLVAGRLAARFDWPMLVRPGIVALSLGFSGLVGVGFGLYPAHRASQLDPIEALRYE